jgi:hypothetical protein
MTLLPKAFSSLLQQKGYCKQNPRLLSQSALQLFRYHPQQFVLLPRSTNLLVVSTAFVSSVFPVLMLLSFHPP